MSHTRARPLSLLLGAEDFGVLRLRLQWYSKFRVVGVTTTGFFFEGAPETSYGGGGGGGELIKSCVQGRSTSAIAVFGKLPSRGRR